MLALRHQGHVAWGPIYRIDAMGLNAASFKILAGLGLTFSVGQASGIGGTADRELHRIRD
ncbi:MAG: hypothetical protein NVSMB6_26770 [Burkholderiaceae bacterium]